MLDSELWGIIGSGLSLLLGILIGTLSYFLKRTLTKIDEGQGKAEKRFNERIVEVLNTADAVEKKVLELEGALYKELRDLQEAFVPRRELEEIVRGLRDSAELNARTMRDSLDENSKVIRDLARKFDDYVMRNIRKD